MFSSGRALPTDKDILYGSDDQLNTLLLPQPPLCSLREHGRSGRQTDAISRLCHQRHALRWSSSAPAQQLRSTAAAGPSLGVHTRCPVAAVVQPPWSGTPSGVPP